MNAFRPENKGPWINDTNVTCSKICLRLFLHKSALQLRTNSRQLFCFSKELRSLLCCFEPRCIMLVLCREKRFSKSNLSGMKLSEYPISIDFVSLSFYSCWFQQLMNERRFFQPGKIFKATADSIVIKYQIMPTKKNMGIIHTNAIDIVATWFHEISFFAKQKKRQIYCSHIFHTGVVHSDIQLVLLITGQSAACNFCVSVPLLANIPFFFMASGSKQVSYLHVYRIKRNSIDPVKLASVCSNYMHSLLPLRLRFYYITFTAKDGQSG